MKKMNFKIQVHEVEFDIVKLNPLKEDGISLFLNQPLKIVFPLLQEQTSTFDEKLAL